MKLLKSKIEESVQMLVCLSEWFRIQKGVRWSGCVTVRRWCVSMGWRRWKWTLPRTCYRCIAVAQLSDTQVRHTLNLIWSANTISFEVWWSEWSPFALLNQINLTNLSNIFQGFQRVIFQADPIWYSTLWSLTQCSSPLVGVFLFPKHICHSEVSLNYVYCLVFIILLD